MVRGSFWCTSPKIHWPRRPGKTPFRDQAIFIVEELLCAYALSQKRVHWARWLLYWVENEKCNRITFSVPDRARCSQYITKRGCSQKKKKNSLYSRYQMFSTFSGALMFSTTTGITFRNIHLQRAQGCFACSLFSFTSYIVPSSHIWPRFTAMESLPSLSRETSSQFESSLTTSMRSFVTRLSVSCYMTPPPPCHSRLQSHREFLVAQRRELWNRQNCPICLHQN